MNKILKKCLAALRVVRGNTLAEFAVVGALMATLAATAAPKLSELAETAKAEKSVNEIDKMLSQARNFYSKTADKEGRGRFPGQEKFNTPVGNYGTQFMSEIEALAAQTQLTDDLENFKSYKSGLGAKWRSVFGVSNATTPRPMGAFVIDDDVASCTNCPGTQKGHDEWLVLFGDNTLISTFQDGHFIYAVIPGGGSGDFSYSPVIFIADLENPRDYNAVLEP